MCDVALGRSIRVDAICVLLRGRAAARNERAAPTKAHLVALLLEVRELARKRKAFDVADRVGDRLAELGYVIDDAAEGPRWRRAR